MSTSDPPFLVVGHLNKPHGTKGEVYVWPLTDRPDTTFVPGAMLLLADESGEAPLPGADPVVIADVRPYRRGHLVRFEGVHDRSGAEGLAGHYVLRRFEDAEPLAEGEVFYHRLLGMKVVTTTGEEVGEVLEVYELRPADLLEVRRWDRTLLIPFTREVVREVRADEGILVLDPPEGLLDL